MSASFLIDRRHVMLGAGALAAFSNRAYATLPDAIEENIAFQIVRNGDEIGYHRLSLKRDGDSLIVKIAVEIVVMFGPIAVFRYTLNGIEQWSDGRVFHLDVRANDDGTKGFCRADRDAQGLWVQGSKAARYLAPENALPATHWNKAELDGPWINPQDGRLFHPVVASLGIGQVPAAKGKTITADHYSLSGDVKLDLWYDSAQHWAGVLFQGKDGSKILYERMD